jgi:anaerobic selenocysteine-containing dehydrogenase
MGQSPAARLSISMRHSAATCRQRSRHGCLASPTAAYADIVLPVASGWEREGLRVGFGLDQDACELVQFRPAIVAPRGEARPDIDIVFDLAVRLGLGEHFWHGDVEAALNHHIAPSGLSMELLRANSRGIRVLLETTYEKYRNGAAATPSGKIEIFSSVLRAGGEPPIPEVGIPFAQTDGFPLTLQRQHQSDYRR